MRLPMSALAMAGAAVLLVSACGSDPEPSTSPTGPSAGPTPAVTAPETSVSPTASPVELNASTIATAVSSPIEIYDGPDGDVAQSIAAEDVLTAPEATPLVFLVKDQADGWLEVYLPVRPNGSTGWVRADDVTVASTDFSVEVSLVDFELTVMKGSSEVLTAPIGVGREERPTPGGVYFIRELLQPPDPTGVYGPYAYGLSGFSPVLDEFNGGDAIIGVHGTNEPDLIGEYVSSGCIRLSNDTITELVMDIGLPLGTPVRISDEAAPVDGEDG
ncbi:L,D-transpeptidase family protein [Demequina sp. SO4-13]|uniref:L,D-transpeptidase family protein n=1 Tax=Demequina sp. SO4-13 TaxID=3401027 RepID=UPI003AF659AA